jgi:hypothetical protein
MRFLPLALICAALVACGSEEAPRSGGLAQLAVRVDDDGNGPNQARTAQLDCASSAQSPACATIAKLKPSELAATPSDTACTQIYGGPETASIRGTLDGQRVNASFKRTDGCEIARWKAVAPLLDEVR